MRRTTAIAHPSLPRGWFIVGAALMSWALFAALWAGTSQLFTAVLAAL